jgi:hypothetical protein
MQTQDKYRTYDDEHENMENFETQQAKPATIHAPEPLSDLPKSNAPVGEGGSQCDDPALPSPATHTKMGERREASPYITCFVPFQT